MFHDIFDLFNILTSSESGFAALPENQFSRKAMHLQFGAVQYSSHTVQLHKLIMTPSNIDNMLNCVFNTDKSLRTTMLQFIGFILMCVVPHRQAPHTSHLNNMHYTGSYLLELSIPIDLGINACGYTSNGDWRR
jgi:hypothetical protein